MHSSTKPHDGRRPASGGVICFGNFIVDRIHTLDCWPARGNLAHILDQEVGIGGGAANVASDLASLGYTGPLAVAGAVGDDADGAFIAEKLLDKGIDTTGLVRLAGQATAHTHVMNVPGEGRTFFYHGGAGDRSADAPVDPKPYAEQGFRFFYLGYLMLMSSLDTLDASGRTGASRLLQAACDAGLATVVDFVSSEDPRFAAQVGAALPFCDYLVINETEAGKATGQTVRRRDGSLDDEALARAASLLIAAGVRRAVVIHAPETCLWHARNEEAFFIASRPVDPKAIVSSVGAGDAFCAGVIFGLDAGWQPARIAEIAHAVAASSLSGKTATDGIPPIDEILAVLAR